MPRFLRASIAALAALAVLSGCAPYYANTLAAPIRDSPLQWGTPVPFDPALHVGSCLSDANGPDSDRDSIVPCDEGHLYDVAGIDTWPGMAELVAERGAGAAYDDLMSVAPSNSGADPDDTVAEYWEWAFPRCRTLLQDALGWSPDAADALWGDGALAAAEVLPAELFYVDASLASRAGFVAGDVSTVCAMAWTDGVGTQVEIADPLGRSVESLFAGGFPSEVRACFDWSASYLDCDTDHGYQGLVTFDATDAYGVTQVGAAIDSYWSGSTPTSFWNRLDDDCAALVTELIPDLDQQRFPVTAYLPDLWYNGVAPSDETVPFPVTCAVDAYLVSDGWDAFTGDVYDQR